MPYPKDNLFYGFDLDVKQKDYIDSMYDNQLTIVNAKAGTGKTTLAVAMAHVLNMKLMYIFAPVQEAMMGFRPGNQSAKEFDYLAPLYSALIEIGENPAQVIYCDEFSHDTVRGKEMALFEKKGKTWVYPKSHTFARGTNISNRFVIIDEAQNFTKNDLKKVLTRIHDNCKVVLIGNTAQIDLKNKYDSGFEGYLNYFYQKPYCKVCILDKNYRGILAQDADNA